MATTRGYCRTGCGGNTKLAEAAGIQGFPKTSEEADKAEQALADDLAKLSLEEQEKVLFDVHGIAQTSDDDPEPAVVDKALEDLQNELDKLPDRTYYDLARASNPSYAEGRSLRLMFLRCFKFDPQPAAQMMECHFKAKHSTFEGLPNLDEIMGRDVRLSDLTPEDLAVLQNGHYQIFPERDAAGRSIWAMNLNLTLPPGTLPINVVSPTRAGESLVPRILVPATTFRTGV